MSTEQYERYVALAPPQTAAAKKGASAAAPASSPTTTPPPSAEERPYALATFMSAQHMMDSAKTRLRDLRFEYGLAAKAFADPPPPAAPPSPDETEADAAGALQPAAAAADVFFVELWHHASKDLFGRLGVKALPMVFVISPGHPGPRATDGASGGGKIKIPEDDEMGRDGASAGGAGAPFSKYPWAAEEMASWLERRVPGSRAAPVERPSFVKSPLFPLAFGAFLACGAALAWRLYGSPLARHRGAWGAGALAVWWFSTSGGMFNVIRGMPLVGIDPRNPGRVAWWSTSRTAQFGMEGFVMGSSYVLFSVLLGAVVLRVPKIKAKGTRSGVAMAALSVAWFVLMRILAAYDSKTGLGKQRQFIGFI